MEQFYGSGSSEALLQKSDTAIIGFAGAFAGGSNNAQYEHMLKNQFGSDNILSFPSVSSKFAFKEPTLSRHSYKTNEYYRSLASQTIDRFPNKNTYVIHCVSGGGIEGLTFAHALLENNKFPAKTIKLLFTGTPGFAEKGTNSLGRVFEFLKRYIDMGINRAEYQHFDLCPPPEEYYSYQKTLRPPLPKDSPGTIVYHDTPDTRKHRREKFYTEYMSFLPKTEKQKVTSQLAGLDESVKSILKNLDSDTPKHLKELMHQRAKLVYSIGGDRYYNEYLAKKPEYKHVPPLGFDGTIVGVLYLLRLLSSVAKGMETRVVDVLHIAEQKHKQLQVSFGIFEKDKLLSFTDIPTIKKRLTKSNTLDSVTDWLLIEGLSHESIDNSPQGIYEALKKLSG